MDFEAGKEITLLQAQKIVSESDDFYIGGPAPEVAIAIVKILIAMKTDGFQLIRLEKLMKGIEKKAYEGIKMDADKADIYMSCLEDLTALVKECLEE